jgi:hypothetical protein
MHGLVGGFLPADIDPAEAKIGIETDHRPWVAALVASGYLVYAINPSQSARARQAAVSWEPRATPVMRMSWLTWSAPVPISYASSPGTASRPAR